MNKKIKLKTRLNILTSIDIRLKIKIDFYKFIYREIVSAYWDVQKGGLVLRTNYTNRVLQTCHTQLNLKV